MKITTCISNIVSKIKDLIDSLVSYRTVGARALVLDQNKILLVEHTYMHGWHTVGGGVNKNESPKQAIIRELSEEVGVTAKSIVLFNVYHKQSKKHNDYIVLYICTDLTEEEGIDALEIKEKRWFALENLPGGISPATLRRVKEYRGEIEVSDKW